jgi:iron complex transport system substrate-binding protein
VRTDNPSLVGKTAFCAEMWDADFGVIGPSAPRTQFLTDVGMVLPDELVRLVGKKYNAPLSAEKLNLLDDLDLVLWSTDISDVDKLVNHKLVAPLKTTREGRYVIAQDGGNDDLLYSIDWGTILSNRFAIENAVPRFVLAVDGDPATDPNT